MKRTLRLILVFLLAAILLACPSCAEENGSKREGLTVSFLSVGQGDAILITLPEGNLLIDGGGDASFAASFVEELERAGVDALDCLIITHPERDHVAYLPALLEEIPVRRAFLPYIEEGFFPLFDETARLAREKGCAVEYTELYDSFAIGGARFVALSPAPVSNPNGEYAAFDGAAGDSANDLSAVFYLEYEGTRFLLTGAASSAVEKNVMRRYEAGLYAAFGVNLEEIDVLKVSHHGSDAATSAEFLSLLAPDCAVISVGAANAYGHPAEDTLERLYRSGAAIYRTDFFGTVRCRVRAGKSLEITSQATENV